MKVDVNNEKIEFDESEENLKTLAERLYAVPRSYFAFVGGILAYARKKPERLQNVMSYLDSEDNLTTSDIVYFVSSQPDFFEDSVRQ